MNDRLPFLDVCGQCPVETVCSAATTRAKCNTDVVYPADSLHPVANPVPGLAPPTRSGVRWAQLPEQLSTVAVGRSDYVGVLDDAALTLRSTRSALRGRAPVQENVVGAFMFGSDPALERLWHGRHLLTQSVGVPVVSPAFSTWLDCSPYEHMIQSIRSLAMATQLALHNSVVPSIPLTPWVRPAMWAEALTGAPEVAVDLGGIGRGLWTRYLGMLRPIADEFSPMPRLLVYGVRSRRRLEDVIQHWPGRIAFASRGPIDYARQGERLEYPSLSPVKDWNYDKGALAVENDRAFRAVVEDLMGEFQRHRVGA